MIDETKESAKRMFGQTTDLIAEYFEKHSRPEQYFFVQFNPKPTISAYEMMQVFLLNNTLFTMYGIMLTPVNPVFMSSKIYYSLDPDLVKDHFTFIGSETLELNEALDRINHSVQ